MSKNMFFYCVVGVVIMFTLFVIIKLSLFVCDCNKSKSAVVSPTHKAHFPDASQKGEIGVQDKFCDQVLMPASSPNVEASEIKNEHPADVDFPMHVGNMDKFNPELATSGTGVGEPALPGANEHPAPFEPKHNTGKARRAAHVFDVAPSDANDEVHGAIDFDVHPPCIHMFDRDATGVGEPAFEKHNEFPSPI